MDKLKQIEKQYKIAIDTQNSVILKSKQIIIDKNEKIKLYQDLVSVQNHMINLYEKLHRKLKPILKLVRLIIYWKRLVRTK